MIFSISVPPGGFIRMIVYYTLFSLPAQFPSRTVLNIFAVTLCPTSVTIHCFIMSYDQ